MKNIIIKKAIIVGAGPAGIGIASLLNQTDIDYVVLEKNDIGASFSDWPENMEMITPSFPSNAFGQIDLNSICEATSPAFSFNKEHLSGEEYSEYLALVTLLFKLKIELETEVQKVVKQKDGWLVKTNMDQYFCKYLIWAAGEFQNPQIENIVGAEHCVHSSIIKSPDELVGDDYIVIGGYESGVQVAYDLVKNHKKVTIVNPLEIDDNSTSDPSRVLSPFTYTKYNKIKHSKLYNEVLAEVIDVTKEENEYLVQLKNKKVIKTNEKPICATGFALVTKPIEEYVTYRADGTPLLVEESDEFYDQKNMYLTGPSVRHDEHIFCFIYKFRQRFGVIVEDILKKERYHAEEIEFLINKWKVNGMYLSDLSCCADECVC